MAGRPRNTISRPRRAGLILLGLLAALLLAAGVLWARAGRFATVAEGRLYRSAALPPADVVELCRREGIRTVVDLRKTTWKARQEQEVLERAGIRHLHLPSTQVPRPEVIERFLEIVDHEPGPILLHCTHGVGRTGALVAVYRMEREGWSPRRAWLEALAIAGFGSFLPGSPKAEFVLRYQRRPKPAAGS